MNHLFVSLVDGLVHAPSGKTELTTELFSTTTLTTNFSTSTTTHGNSTHEEEFHPTIFNPGTPLLIVYGVALLFTIVTWVLGFHLIILHLRYMTVPRHQMYIIRVLLICPLYAMYSLVALVLMEYQVYLLIFRDAYEAYVLWQFMALCIEYIGGEQAVLEHLNGQPPMRLEIPLCCIQVMHWEKFYVWVKRGIIQYMIVRPLMAIVSIILELFGKYGDGDIFNFEVGFFYVVTVQNICLTISMYCLVVFYHATADALKPYKPLLKFISIKIILFFVFWQGVAIASLMWFGWIPSAWHLEPEEFGIALQNLIVTVEMALIAILHLFAFPVDMYRIKAQSQAPLVHEVEVDHNAIKAVGKTINQIDVVKATAQAFKIRGKRRKGADLDQADIENPEDIDFGEQFKSMRAMGPSSDKPRSIKPKTSSSSSDQGPAYPDQSPKPNAGATEAVLPAPPSASQVNKPTSMISRIKAIGKTTKYEVLDEPPTGEEPADPQNPTADPQNPTADISASSSSSVTTAAPSSSTDASTPSPNASTPLGSTSSPIPSPLPAASPLNPPSTPQPPSQPAPQIDEDEDDEDEDDGDFDPETLAAAIRTSTFSREQLDDDAGLFEVDEDDISRLPTDTYSKTAKSKARR